MQKCLWSRKHFCVSKTKNLIRLAADTIYFRAAGWTLAFRRWLAVFHRNALRIFYLFLGLAFNAICFCHFFHLLSGLVLYTGQLITSQLVNLIIDYTYFIRASYACQARIVFDDGLSNQTARPRSILLAQRAKKVLVELETMFRN